MAHQYMPDSMTARLMYQNEGFHERLLCAINIIQSNKQEE